MDVLQSYVETRRWLNYGRVPCSVKDGIRLHSHLTLALHHVVACLAQQAIRAKTIEDIVSNRHCR